MDLPPALYLPAEDGWLATALTIGPWDPGLQHAGPPAAGGAAWTGVALWSTRRRGG